MTTIANTTANTEFHVAAALRQALATFGFRLDLDLLDEVKIDDREKFFSGIVRSWHNRTSVWMPKLQYLTRGVIITKRLVVNPYIWPELLGEVCRQLALDPDVALVWKDHSSGSFQSILAVKGGEVLKDQLYINAAFLRSRFATERDAQLWQEQESYRLSVSCASPQALLNQADSGGRKRTVRGKKNKVKRVAPRPAAKADAKKGKGGKKQDRKAQQRQAA